MKPGSTITYRGERVTVCDTFPDGRCTVMVGGKPKTIKPPSHLKVEPKRKVRTQPKRQPANHKQRESLDAIQAKQRSLAESLGLDWQRVVELATANELGIDETLEALR